MSAFDYDDEDWKSGVNSTSVQYNKVLGSISAQNSFKFPAEFLSDKRYSYNQHLRFNLKVEKEDSSRRKLPGKLLLSGFGKDQRQVVLQCNLNSQFGVGKKQSII